METIQIVIDPPLLKAADRAAKKTRLNRSAFIREALRQHLRRLESKEMEDRDRVGYTAGGRGLSEAEAWEREAVWPAD